MGREGEGKGEGEEEGGREAGLAKGTRKSMQVDPPSLQIQNGHAVGGQMVGSQVHASRKRL